MVKKLTAGLASLLLFGTVGTGAARPMKTEAASRVEDQHRQFQQELKVSRSEVGELKAAGGRPIPTGPGQLAAGPGMRGRRMGPMMPQRMQPMVEMMRARAQVTGAMTQLGGMEAMTPSPETRSPEEREVTEHGTARVAGLEVTLLSARPLSPAEMRRLMPGTGETGGMPGMGGMMRGMPGMQGMMPGTPGMEGTGAREAPPTHWIGVIVRDLTDDKVVPELDITLTVRRAEVTRTTKLMPMPGSYGAHVSLPQRGRYAVTITIARPAGPVSVAVELDVR